MKQGRIIALALGAAIVFAAAVPLWMQAMADSSPEVKLSVANVRPHQLEDSTQSSIVRDYGKAWRDLKTALANNAIAPLGNYFTGYALEKLTQRVKDQQHNGLKTRIIDHGHKLDAIFYARDGSTLEFRDTASLEMQVLDGDSVIHSDQAQVQYLCVMTGGADRWYVRVLEEAPGH